MQSKIWKRQRQLRHAVIGKVQDEKSADATRHQRKEGEHEHRLPSVQKGKARKNTVDEKNDIVSHITTILQANPKATFAQSQGTMEMNQAGVFLEVPADAALGCTALVRE